MIEVPVDYSENDRILNQRNSSNAVPLFDISSEDPHMLQETYPFFLANEPSSPNNDLAVTDKYTGEVATRVALADAVDDRCRASRRRSRQPSRCGRCRPTSGRPS